MANGLIQQLALVSDSDKVSFEELAIVSAALQKQATRDLAPIWDIGATIDPFPRLEDVPLGYWPMIVMDDIGFDGAAGIHLDKDGQPFALISSSDDQDEWSLTASHETLEMLVDPFGNRTVAGDSPKSDQGRVLFLVEVSDPSEAAEFGYSVNGVLVSDFYTPRYFDPVASGVRYSFTNSLTEPRQVLRGGYLSWQEPVSGHWWQETFFSGNSSTFRDLGRLTAADGSIRSQIDKLSGRQTARAINPARRVAAAAGLTRAAGARSVSAKAASLREQISGLVSAGQPASASAGGSSSRRATRRTGGN